MGIIRSHGNRRSGIKLDDKNFELALTRDDFETLVGDIVERTIKPCMMALADAGIEPGQIDEVVLVGGSTRMPLVRKQVQELFGQAPKCDLNRRSCCTWCSRSSRYSGWNFNTRYVVA